ncbi:hypothetical protein EYR36_009167 [Pleurotus pulmonarius]|nr:hypothetical protein EYR36_009167 [Pleurotus pulmonarius]KAF4592661.1 hypothetical protein EYR38_008360 [Pleurotus pulmonarius]
MDAFLNASNWVVLVTGMSYYVTATPPNRRVNQSELLINTWVERFFLPRLMLLKLFVGSACFMHVFSSVFSLGTCTLRTSHGSSGSLALPSTTMMIGSSLALVSANIRLWCYTEMRDLYDFEVNIKKAHRLVTTGPYSLVRHPGYIASCVARIGVSMVMFSVIRISDREFMTIDFVIWPQVGPGELHLLSNYTVEANRGTYYIIDGRIVMFYRNRGSQDSKLIRTADTLDFIPRQINFGLLPHNYSQPMRGSE